MYDLAIAILGNGDTTQHNAGDLLWDLLPDDNFVVYLPSYIQSDGLKNVVKVLNDYEIPFKRVRRSSLIETLENTETKSHGFVILNSDGIENEISRCFQMKIPVWDLTRGLYQLTELPTDGSEADAEAISADPGTPVGSEETILLETRVAILEKEVKRLSTMVGETNWEPVTATGVVEAMQHIQETYSNPEGVPYWKSKRGKFRKAGKSQPRPGEVKVFLTQEEIDKLE